MFRTLNVVAVLALLGSAVYAYQIKYETIYYAEQLVKMRHAIDRERNSIGLLRAEWAHLTRPERVQGLSDKFLDVQAMTLPQIVKAEDLPAKVASVDTIGRKLEALGLGAPTNTPQDGKTPSATPSTSAR